MASPNTINLIRTKTIDTSSMNVVEVSLRKSGLTSVVVFLVISVIVGSLYAFVYYQNASLISEEQQLVTRVNAVKNKEGFLLAIKDRTTIVQKAMENQRPWAKLIDLISTFTLPPSLSSIAVDDQNKIVLTVHAKSIDETLTIVNKIIEYANENTIKNPQLLSFQLGKSGGVDMSLSFFAVF